MGFKFKFNFGKAVRNIVRDVSKVAPIALPIAGAVFGAGVGGGLLGSVLGKVGGGLLGSVLGKVGGGLLGSTLGRVAGGLVLGGLAGSLLSGRSGLNLTDKTSIQTIIPPHAQKGAEILEGLLGQSSQYAQTVASIKRPYLYQAEASFENLQRQIPELFDRAKGEISSFYDKSYSDISSLFGKAKGEISSLYDYLLGQTKNIITSEQAKQNARLGALGLLNTQAQQWTMSDILNRTALPILERKTEALAGLVGSETRALTNLIGEKTRKLTGLSEAQTDTMLKYLFAKPDFYVKFANEMVSTNPYLLEQQYKLDIAKAMMSIPTIVQPTYKQGLLGSLASLVGSGIGLYKLNNYKLNKLKLL